jgi:predicted transcriptional regulator
VDKVRAHRRELLRAVMIKAQLTPDEIASAMGRHRVTVYKWLAGDHPVPASVEQWLLNVAPQLFRGEADA